MYDKELIEDKNLITPFYTFEDLENRIKKKRKEQQTFKEIKTKLNNKICRQEIEAKRKRWEEINTANTIINKFKDFEEIIIYKDNFYFPKGSVETSVDRTRKWLKDEAGVLHPQSENVKIEDLQRTILSSRKRTLDNIYGFILSNDWNYIVTVTFKHGKSKKLSDSVVKYQWQKFRQQLQYRFPDIKIILIPEDTPTGNHGMHFHGVFGNCDLDEYLQPARNNDKTSKYYGEFIYTKFGDPVFNFLPSFVNIGFTNVVKIRENNSLKIINYFTKYMHKGSTNFDYNENAYLRTYNLDFKEKKVLNFTEEEQNEFVNNLFVQQYKETNKMIVYRRYK